MSDADLEGRRNRAWQSQHKRYLYIPPRGVEVWNGNPLYTHLACPSRGLDHRLLRREVEFCGGGRR